MQDSMLQEIASDCHDPAAKHPSPSSWAAFNKYGVPIEGSDAKDVLGRVLGVVPKIRGTLVFGGPSWGPLIFERLPDLK